MAAKANIAKSYRVRLGIIALALLGFAGWAAYDGFVYWPKLVERWDAYEQIVADHPQDFQEVWQEEAASRGWPTRTPSKKTQGSLLGQYVIMGLTLPVGLYFAFAWVRAGGRWVETHEGGVRTSRGDDVAWDQIHSIDKTRWKNKGIADVAFDGPQGPAKIRLDDWKFDRDPTTAILSEIEARTGLGDGGADENGDAPEPRKGSLGEAMTEPVETGEHEAGERTA